MLALPAGVLTEQAPSLSKPVTGYCTVSGLEEGKIWLGGYVSCSRERANSLHLKAAYDRIGQKEHTEVPSFALVDLLCPYFSLTVKHVHSCGYECILGKCGALFPPDFGATAEDCVCTELCNAH